jgi:hypothetical protein
MPGWTKFAIAAALAAGLASSAHAQKFAEYDEQCGSAPYGPSIPTDTSITDAKIAELKTDVLEFLKASDRFQDCVTKIIEEGPTFKKEDSMEKKIQIAKRFERQGLELINDNQSEKEKIGRDYNALIDARKKTNQPAAK